MVDIKPVRKNKLRPFPSEKAISILCFMLSQSRVGLVVYHSLVSGGKEATDHPPIIGQYPH